MREPAPSYEDISSALSTRSSLPSKNRPSGRLTLGPKNEKQRKLPVSVPLSKRVILQLIHCLHLSTDNVGPLSMMFIDRYHNRLHPDKIRFWDPSGTVT
jgi:hypothetical protein